MHDSRGNHSYSKVPKGKNCHSVSNLDGNFSTTSAYKPAVTTPDTNSKDADSAARNQPDQAAISAARKNLADAKKALEDGKKIRMGNERNYMRYQERITSSLALITVIEAAAFFACCLNPEAVTTTSSNSASAAYKGDIKVWKMP